MDTFTDKKQRHMLFVEVVNSVEEENGKRNVEYAGKTGKEDFHGYGLMNVQQIIERHNGEMSCLLMKGKYLVNILMYKGGEGMLRKIILKNFRYNLKNYLFILLKQYTGSFPFFCVFRIEK